MRSPVLPLPLPSANLLDVRRVVPSGHSLVVAFAIIAAAAGLYAGGRYTSAFSIERVEVYGVEGSSAARVRRALAPLVGTSLLALRMGEVESRLARLPEVEAVTYDRAFPHTLHVDVRPERPAAVLRTGGDSWLVSARARVIRRLARGAAPTLPRVWVARTESVTPGETLDAETGGRAARALAVLLGSRLSLPVRTVNAPADELTFVLRSGVEIRFGSTADLPLKLAVARRALPFVSGRGTYLDVSVPERPVSGQTLNPEVEP